MLPMQIAAFAMTHRKHRIAPGSLSALLDHRNGSELFLPAKNALLHGRLLRGTFAKQLCISAHDGIRAEYRH